MTALPRRPVLGWSSWRGQRNAGIPCLLDRPRVLLTRDGRSSILLALEAAGIGPGDPVLVPTYHCPTMVSPVHTLGARPVFYPITETGAPDAAWLAGPGARGARAMLAAHFFGLPQPMETVAAWCRDRGIVLIEDCAHALFGQAGARPIGDWGHYAIGSLTKFLPVADGGCLVAHADAPLPVLAVRPAAAHVKAALDAAELGAVHGRLPVLGAMLLASLRTVRRLRGGATPAALHGTEPPAAAVEATTLDRRLAHAAITHASAWLARRLPRGPIVEQRRRNHARLARRLAGCRALRPLATRVPEGSAPYVFPVWADQPDPGYQQLRRLGVPVYRWDAQWPGTPAIEGDHGPAWSHHVLQIGCHQDLRDADIEFIADTLIRVFETPHEASADGP